MSIQDKAVNIGIIVVIVLIVGSLIASPIIAFSTKDTVTVTVTDKERIGDRDSSRYLIFTDRGTFENTDTLWYWKFNSSDVYGKLKKGQKYTMNVYGWRVPFLSWYKNIISAKIIKEE